MQKWPIPLIVITALGLPLLGAPLTASAAGTPLVIDASSTTDEQSNTFVGSASSPDVTVATSADSIALVWTPVADAQSYRWRSRAAGGTWSEYTRGLTTSADITELLPNSSYDIQVGTRRADRWRNEWTTMTVTTASTTPAEVTPPVAPPTTAPAPEPAPELTVAPTVESILPTDVAATWDGRKASITWAGGRSDSTFRVRYRIGNRRWSTPSFTSARNLDIRGLGADTTYAVQVGATVDGRWTATWSESASLITTIAPVPAAVLPPTPEPAPPTTTPVEPTPASAPSSSDTSFTHGTGLLTELSTVFGPTHPLLPKAVRNANLDRMQPSKAVSMSRNICTSSRESGMDNLVLTVMLAWDAKSPKIDPEGSLAALRAVGAGDFDDVYRGIAEELTDCGYDQAIIRLGHEHNMKWTPWWSGGGRAADFVAAWQRAHDVMTEVNPNLLFDWNVGAQGSEFGGEGSTGGFDPASYPGDEYVDIIGRDYYCRSQGRKLDKVAHEIDTHLQFAALHGKPVSFPELGITHPVDGVTAPSNAGDDKTCAPFMELLLDTANSSDLAYLTHWNARKTSQGYGYQITQADTPLTWKVLEKYYGRA